MNEINRLIKYHRILYQKECVRKATKRINICGLSRQSRSHTCADRDLIKKPTHIPNRLRRMKCKAYTIVVMTRSSFIKNRIRFRH